VILQQILAWAVESDKAYFQEVGFISYLLWVVAYRALDGVYYEYFDCLRHTGRFPANL
jgi:hypothetical protein